MTPLDTHMRELVETFDPVIDRSMPGWIDELIEFCRIPSETGQAQPLRDAASWIAERMRRMEATVREVSIDGVPPLVVGEIGDGPATVVCVQHYDVQPADPVSQWTTPPYEPAVRDGRVFARGAFDNKGQLLLRLQAVDAYLRLFGDLPCRVRFLAEGEEESGSRHLADLLAQEPGVLDADAALNEAGYFDADGRPMLTCGLRGIVYLELRVRTLSSDAHSGTATLLPNAAWRLVNALATLVDRDGRILVDGLQDAAVPPMADQLEHLRATPFDEEGWKRIHGTSQFIAGRQGFEAQVASVFAPTFNLSGVAGGWSGSDMKTVIPAEAMAKIDARLVPNQDPAEIAACVRRHLDARGFSDIDIDTLSAERPWWTPIDADVVEAAADATRAVYGAEPLRATSARGSGPLYQVCSPHGLPAVGLGCGHPDHRAHAPDENIRIDAMCQAIKVFGRFLPSFAATV